MTAIPEFLRLVLALAALPLLACGDGNREGPDQEPGAPDAAVDEDWRLVIEPADIGLTIGDGERTEATVRVLYRDSAGTQTDVTADAALEIAPPALVDLDGATVRAAGRIPGRGIVRARYRGATAEATLAVRVIETRLLPGTPAEAPALFAAANEDPRRAPTIVYPADDAIVPPNLGVLDVHWRDQAGSDLFELRLQSPLLDLRVYTRATSPAHFAELNRDVWPLIGASQRGESLTLTVRGLRRAEPGTAGTSSTLALHVARTDIDGALYYWSTSDSGIMRVAFGAERVRAQTFFGNEDAQHCVGCHGLSPDGARMAITYDGQDGPATVVDVATGTPLFPADGTMRSNFSTFSDDGTRLVGTYRGTLSLHDAATGHTLATVPTEGLAAHPDLAPGSDRLVWVSREHGGDVFPGGEGDLYIQDVELATPSFGEPVLLVDPGPQRRACYPSFSPDGAWVLFNVTAGDCYDDADAQLWAVPADRSAPPVHLAGADFAAGLTNSWPRWAPTVDTTAAGEQMYWFTISSKRAFGVRNGQGTPQLWMAPFFPERARLGASPGGPLIWLPFQDPATNNHLAQWTRELIGPR